MFCSIRWSREPTSRSPAGPKRRAGDAFGPSVWRKCRKRSQRIAQMNISILPDPAEPRHQEILASTYTSVAGEKTCTRDVAWALRRSAAVIILHPMHRSQIAPRPGTDTKKLPRPRQLASPARKLTIRGPCTLTSGRGRNPTIPCAFRVAREEARRKRISPGFLALSHTFTGRSPTRTPGPGRNFPFPPPSPPIFDHLSSDRSLRRTSNRDFHG